MTDAELAAAIDRAVEVRCFANEYKTLCVKINAELKARRINSFAAPSGSTAEFEPKPKRIWLLDKLADVLKRPLFAAFCPRKPDTKKLNQRLAACVEGSKERRELAGCYLDKPRCQLRLRAPGETAVDEPEEDEDSDE